MDVDQRSPGGSTPSDQVYESPDPDYLEPVGVYSGITHEYENTAQMGREMDSGGPVYTNIDEHTSGGQTVEYEEVAGLQTSPYVNT